MQNKIDEPTRRSNLARLAKYVLTERPQITMKYFLTGRGERTEQRCLLSDTPSEAAALLQSTCGTAGCFLGYGPSAGIRPQNGPITPGLTPWSAYSELFAMGWDAWDFLFGSAWPNDAEQCAKRARWYLDGGDLFHALDEIPIDFTMMSVAPEDFDPYILKA